MPTSSSATLVAVSFDRSMRCWFSWRVASRSPSGYISASVRTSMASSSCARISSASVAWLT